MVPQGSAGDLTPRELRQRARAGTWIGPTSGCCDGFVQANLVVVPAAYAPDFLTFCLRNPQPCPVIEALAPGEFEPVRSAPGADLRTDIPAYRVYRGGELREQRSDLLGVWRDDLVAFLLGCSFTFEAALSDAGIPLRHLEEGKNVPMYVTTVPTRPAGVFVGPLVVSMRPIPDRLVYHAIEITGRFPLAHGAPVHVGDPEEIGITELGRPDFGDAVTIQAGEVPVFWACGTTPQAVARNARLDLLITHEPGHMFLSDLRYDDLKGP